MCKLMGCPYEDFDDFEDDDDEVMGACVPTMSPQKEV